MKPLSASAHIRRRAPAAFRSWRWVFLSAMLLAVVTFGALYVEVAQAQDNKGAITAQVTQPQPAARSLIGTAVTPKGQVLLSWVNPSDDSITGYQVLRGPDADSLVVIEEDTGSSATNYTDTEPPAGQTHTYAVKARNSTGLSPQSNTATATVPTSESKEELVAAQQHSCPGSLPERTPSAVQVDAVPIVVDSTTADYFVLYVKHDLDGTEVKVPVLVKKGAAGTTTLAENIEALPTEGYRLEKYLIAEPADVDGDCIDDITELDDTAGNPVNPATAIALNDGAVTVPDQETFKTLAREYSGKMSIKVVLLDTDTDRPSIYFTNVKTHTAHNPFLDAVGIDRSQLALGEGLVYGTIEYDLDGSPGGYYFWVRPSNTYYSVARMEYFYTLLAASMPLLDDNLAVYMGNSQLRFLQPNLLLYSESRIPLVFDKDIYPETSFLALNPGEGYGLLRVMEPKERPNPRDIVIYEALPNELPRVAGVISTVPQTPLTHVNLRAVQDRIPNAFIREALDQPAIASLLDSYVHVNLRAVQDRIPNAFIREALDQPAIASLLDSYVHYTVTQNGYTIQAATKTAVDNHYASSRPTLPQTPQRDLSVTSITPLSEIGFGDWEAFGVKAANVAVLGTLGFPSGTVPDGYAIPFYFYDEFMKHNDFYTRIQSMLDAADFQDDYDTQEDKLKKLRKAIENAETPEWILTALADMNRGFTDGINRRYRSSTNNEDLPGFNGAGLYDSKSQKPSEDEKDLAKSLKEVYASLWTFRAFIERDFHRVDHLKTAMGILVHSSYQDELANGVAVSIDPTTRKPDDYYVNTQLGEDLVTNPEAHSVPEEIMLHQNRYTVLATSNQVEPGELLMSDAQLTQLREHLTTIHDHFKRLYNPTAGESFAMEIEFKITSENILAIKQARPWVFGSNVTGTVVGVNEPPVINTGSRTEFTYRENGTAVLYTYRATDPERGSISWSVSGTDWDDFDISETGVLYFITPPNFEIPGDSDRNNVYNVTVQAHDDEFNTASLDVTVTVTEVNEGPEVTSGGDSFTVQENQDWTGASFTASDPEGSTITRWSLGGSDGGDFNISETGVLTFRTTPDHERPDDSNRDNVYEVEVRPYDGRYYGSHEVMVMVEDVNEITGTTTLNRSENFEGVLATYSATGQGDLTAVPTWRLRGTDSGDFTISEQGEFTFRSTPDHERPADSNRNNVYNFVVQASDGRYYGTLDVTVTVTPVNEPPTITTTSSSATALQQNENQTSRLYTYSATDPERSTVTWSVGGVDGRFFAIDERGQFSFSESSPPDFERPGDSGRDNVYNVTIEVRDDGLNTSSLPVTVTVREVNEGPEVTDGQSAFTISENQDLPNAVYSGFDPEGGTVTRWTVGGRDGGDFKISQEGTLTFRNTPDYERPADSNRDPGGHRQGRLHYHRGQQWAWGAGLLRPARL